MVMPYTTTTLVGSESSVARSLAALTLTTLRRQAPLMGRTGGRSSTACSSESCRGFGEAPRPPGAMGCRKKDEETAQLPPFARSF